MAGRSALNIHDGADPRVLIVDDNPVNNALVKATLDRERIRCVAAVSGEDALDALKRQSFELVLLDIELPDVSGYDVLRSIRERQSSLAFLPVILLTGRTDQQSRIDGLEAGATDFLTKPFDPAELVARIRNHIGAKRLYDKLMLANQLLEEERAKIFLSQLALLPSSMPTLPGLRFGAGYLASSVASGDYYDVMVRQSGNVVLAVGDVSGHGIASAMQMSILRATLHARIAEGKSIEGVLRDLNAILGHSLDEYSFVTFFLAEFDPTTGRLWSVSAGHHPPLVQNLATGTISELLIETCCPLGLEPGLAAPMNETVLMPGHRLILYTDGLIEQSAPDGRFFDAAGVAESLGKSYQLGPQAAVDRLTADLRQFGTLERPEDDVTILIMDFMEPRAPRP